MRGGVTSFNFSGVEARHMLSHVTYLDAVARPAVMVDQRRPYPPTRCPSPIISGASTASQPQDLENLRTQTFTFATRTCLFTVKV